MYTVRTMKQPVVTSCSWTVEGTMMCFGISCCVNFNVNFSAFKV
jgi:hypothetical protein